MPLNHAHSAVTERPANDSAVRNINLAGVELPIPHWCFPAFGMIAIAYVGLTLLSQPLQTTYSRYLLGKTEEQDQQEAYKHFSEIPVTEWRDADHGGTLEARMFRDGCVSVSWQDGITHSSAHPHFIRRVAGDQGGPAPGPQTATSLTASPDVRLAGVGAFELPFFRPRSVGVSAASEGPSTTAATQSGCLNPHPGSFTTSYGTRNGCWVQTWRQFQDGCKHYQWFNSCTNQWDVNPDGSPKVYWTSCRH